MVKRLTGAFLLSVVFALYGYSASTDSTSNKLYRHELGLDVTDVLTFLSKSPQSYSLNYRYYFSEKVALRARLNLSISNGASEGIYPGLRVGFQINNRVKKSRWNIYYGLDGSGSYFKDNLVATYTTTVGLSPFVGVQYYFNKHLSLSTEISLDYYYYFVLDETGFTAKNENYYKLSIGSVGMVLVSYHF